MTASSVLKELERATESVSERVGPAVVGIGHGWGQGSGVVVADGQVLTNAHNLRADEVPLTFDDGRTATARVAGVDIDGDLAVLSVDTSGATAVEWSESGGARVGSVVFALANPGGRGRRVTAGQVSSVGRSFRGPRGRRVTGSVEHTAPLARGSSGGPVVDADGRLLGLNTNRLGEGFYLAIPADADLKARVESLAKGESADRRRLGVGLVPGKAARRLRRAVGLPDLDGVLIQVVDEEGVAGRAGLREGDLVVRAGDRPVANVDDLHAALDALGPGSGGSLTLALVRGAEELDLTVVFDAQTPEPRTP